MCPVLTNGLFCGRNTRSTYQSHEFAHSYGCAYDCLAISFLANIAFDKHATNFLATASPFLNLHVGNNDLPPLARQQLSLCLRPIPRRRL